MTSDFSIPNTDPALEAAVGLVARELNESNPGALEQISNMFRVMGADFVQNLLAETLETEAKGGITFADGSRRRSPGGVFFYLAKQKLTDEQKYEVFEITEKKMKRAAAAQQSPPAPRKRPRVERRPAIPVEQTVVEIGPMARQMALQITRELRDYDTERREVIERIVEVGGQELAKTALSITLEMEAQGGIKKKDGTRRSAGGAFLYIASRRLSEEQRRMVWPQVPEELSPPSAPPPTYYRERPAALTPSAPAIPAPYQVRAATPQGYATSIKISLVGRPADVETHYGYVSFHLESNRLPSMIRDLPVPFEPTTYVVYVPDRIWEKVSRAAANPNDSLIIEGFPMLHTDTGTIIVQAITVFSKQYQQSRTKPRTTPSRY